jgi:DNA repair exonuclease SbcCD ATPase subunit
MKYIKSIEITNFQSHKNSRISFENGLNVICGPSDNGKSAIIRALKWVLYNEPKGTDFITQGENSCRVSITLSDGTIVTRERSGGKNIYRLSNQDGNETTFEGFGTDIPPEILNAHGIIRLHIDSSSSQCINIADQLEAPFLISQPGSVKAKAIGKLVGVNVIDEAIKELGKEISSIQSQERNIQTELEAIKEQLKAYEGLPRLKEHLAAKEKRINRIKAMSDRYSKLSELQKNLNTLEIEIDKNKQTTERYKHIDKAAALLTKLQDDSSRAIRIERAAQSYRNVDADIRQQKAILQRTRNVDGCMFKITNAYESVIRYNQLSIHSNRLSIIGREITSLRRSLESLKATDNAGELSTRLSECIRRLDRLSTVKKSYDSVSDSIRKGQEYTKMFLQIDNADKESIRLERLKDRHKQLTGLQNEIKEQSREIDYCKKDIQACDVSMKRALEEYKQVLKIIGRCPVCFSPIDEHTMEDIVREFEGGSI